MRSCPRNGTRAHRARLELLAPPTRPPLTAYLPPRRLPRRPGERREPLGAVVSPRLRAAASARGLDVRCAAELCLERALVVRDLATFGRDDLYPPILATAAAVTVTESLPPAKARYLRMLVVSRDRVGNELDAPRGASHEADDARDDVVVDVPLRLFPRVARVADAVANATEDDLAEALALEIAAVSDGRTMCEWAAVAALELSL